MDFDHEEARRRRDYEKARDAQRKQEEKLAELKRSARSARSRLLASTTKSETWHRMSLAWLERDAQYTGEMAAARVWLRSLPFPDYVEVMSKVAATMSADARNIDVEYAAISANLKNWSILGDALLLQRAKEAYSAELSSFHEWQNNNPDSTGWRAKPATRHQGFLIKRMVDHLGIEPPMRMNRGEAHDWIQQHGGNPRLEPDDTKPDGPTPPYLHTGAVSDTHGGEEVE